MYFTIAAAVLNMVLVYPMFLWLGPVGCAVATSIAGWMNVLLLWMGLGRAGFMKLAPGFTGRVIRLFVAAVIMGGIVWGLAHYGQGFLMSEGRFIRRFSGMGGLVTIGLIAYLAAVVGLRVYSLEELKKRFRRGKKAA